MMFEGIILGVMLTQHIDHCDKCNEMHPYVAAEFSTPLDSVTARLGGYYNSGRNLSLTAGARWQSEWAFVEAGIATGYDFASDWPVTPVGRVGVHWNGFEAFAFPGISNGSPKLGVGVSYNIRIGG